MEVKEALQYFARLVPSTEVYLGRAAYLSLITALEAPELKTQIQALRNQIEELQTEIADLKYKKPRKNGKEE